MPARSTDFAKICLFDLSINFIFFAYTILTMKNVNKSYAKTQLKSSKFRVKKPVMPIDPTVTVNYSDKVDTNYKFD